MNAYAGPVSYTDLLNRPSSGEYLRIAYGKDPDQFGELWLPKNVQAPIPVVVLIHGGCWQASLPGLELINPVAEDLSAHGVAVWNIEYKRLGAQGGGYPGTFLDVADGIDALNTIAADYHLDLSKVVVAGHSAGGHLALWAASRKRIAKSSLLHKDQPLPIHSVVTLAGINDLKAYRDRGPGACGEPDTIDDLVNAKGRSGDPYLDTSPAALLPINVRQVIISGSLDTIVPAAFGDTYSHAARQSGDHIKTLTFKDAGHFDLIDRNLKTGL
jgi:acetyl esterase/lipase